MNLLDIKTVLFSYVVSNAISATVIFMLWLQNRRCFEGLGLWLADFMMQFIALFLVMLRGIVPDFVSMTVSNSLIIGGTILLYMGLERFVGKRSAPTYNIILLAVFIPAHAYFAIVHPNLGTRTIILMAGVLVLCLQCAWLMLRRVDAETRPITHNVGLVFAGYCLVSAARILVNLAFPSDNNFFNPNSLDALLVMTDQMLFIILTFYLFLMVNRRLVTDLEHDITVRKRVEEELRLSEEKFFKAFHSSPDAILLTRLSDGELVEVNEGFAHLTGFSREETLEKSTLDLDIWVNPQDREKYITALMENHRIRDHEYEFRTKSGRILNGLCSGEIIYLGDDAHILSIVRDITAYKQIEDALQKQTMALTERVKELNCISELASLIEIPGNSLAEILLGSVNLLRAAMQYPESASVKLVIGEQSYTTDNYRDSACKLSEEITDGGRTMGVLEVCYPQELQQEKEILFWEEERSLLHIVADRLGHVFRRMRTEEALRESETIFSSFLENSPVYVFFKDKNIRPLRLSKNYEQMLGRPASEAIGKTMDELFPSDLAKSMVADDLRILIEGRRVDTVEELNGRIYETTKFPIYKDGKPDLLAGFTVDITERKQAEEIIQLRLKLFEFSATHSLDELMQNALDEIGRITSSPIGFYHFVEPDQKTLSLQAWSTRTLEEFCRAEGKGMHYNLDQAGVWVDCVRQRKPVIHNNYAALPHRKGMPAGHAEVVREVVVPTLRDGRIVSILGVGNKPSDYDGKDIESVSYIADVVWGIVERKRAEEEIQLLQVELREQAIRDPLTGLYNRRYLNETSGRELAHAERENYPISFVIIDIDQFKKGVNDRFGHIAGDAMLQKLSVQLQSQVRYGDIVCRYGGDEFLAILLNVSAETAFQIAERWRLSFLESTLLLDYSGIKATISCGVSEFPIHGKTYNELISMADKALYHAKASGRNRVVIWQTEHKE